MLALGIDPGSWRTGWGLVRQDGSRVRLVEAGTITVQRGVPMAARLAALHERMAQTLDRCAPDRVGIESVFHGANTRSLVVLGQARGALIAAIGSRGLIFGELSPAEVKKAVTGRGRASKEQVAHMVGALLGPRVRELGVDASDALAVAIALLHRDRFRSLTARPPGRTSTPSGGG